MAHETQASFTVRVRRPAQGRTAGGIAEIRNFSVFTPMRSLATSSSWQPQAALPLLLCGRPVLEVPERVDAERACIGPTTTSHLLMAAIPEGRGSHQAGSGALDPLRGSPVAMLAS